MSLKSVWRCLLRHGNRWWLWRDGSSQVFVEKEFTSGRNKARQPRGGWIVYQMATWRNTCWMTTGPPPAIRFRRMAHADSCVEIAVTFGWSHLCRRRRHSRCNSGTDLSNLYASISPRRAVACNMTIVPLYSQHKRILKHMYIAILSERESGF